MLKKHLTKDLIPCPKTNIETVIVAAYQKELNPLCRLGRRFLVIKDNIAFLSAGIGPVAACFGLTHFLKMYRPKKILTLGTAGYVNPLLKIGDIVQAKTVYCNTKQGLLEYPKKPSLLKQVSVYCPQTPSTTDNKRNQLWQSGFDTENLEAFAFAYVAKKFRVPIISLLGITNEVGAKGHGQWKKNEHWVCEKLALFVKNLQIRGL